VTLDIKNKCDIYKKIVNHICETMKYSWTQEIHMINSIKTIIDEDEVNILSNIQTEKDKIRYDLLQAELLIKTEEGKQFNIIPIQNLKVIDVLYKYKQLLFNILDTHYNILPIKNQENVLTVPCINMLDTAIKDFVSEEHAKIRDIKMRINTLYRDIDTNQRSLNLYIYDLHCKYIKEHVIHIKEIVSRLDEILHVYITEKNIENAEDELKKIIDFSLKIPELPINMFFSNITQKYSEDIIKIKTEIEQIKQKYIRSIIDLRPKKAGFSLITEKDRDRISEEKMLMKQEKEEQDIQLALQIEQIIKQNKQTYNPGFWRKIGNILNTLFWRDFNSGKKYKISRNKRKRSYHK
jgi:hypothetical protein